MAKINFKKVLSFLMALCMIMSLFTCVSILPTSAATSDLVEFYSLSNNYARMEYLKGWSTFKAGNYRFELDCKIFSGTPTIRIGMDSSFGTSNPSLLNYTANYDANNFKYTITFSLSADKGCNLNIDVGNYGTDGLFACANPTLYLLDANGNPTGSSLINTFTSTYYTTSTTNSVKKDKWRTAGMSGNFTCTSIPAGYFDPSVPEQPEEPETPETPETPVTDKMFHVNGKNTSNLKIGFRNNTFTSTDSKFVAGKEYRFTCKYKNTNPNIKLDSGMFWLWYYNTSASIVRINSANTDAVESYNKSTFEYTLTFTMPDDCRDYNNAYIYFADYNGSLSGYEAYFADFKLENLTDNTVVNMFPEITSSNVYTSSEEANNKWRVPVGWDSKVTIEDIGNTFDPVIIPFCGGDANDDGNVDVRDLVCFKSIMTGNISTELSLDANEDNKVDAIDLSIMIKILLNKGKSARLYNTYYKLNYAKSLNISYIGGSVTGGVGASADENGWAYLVTKYLKQKYPNAKITESNMGVGGTGSYLGMARFENNVIENKPDLVFIEFAINDRYNDIPEEQTKQNIEYMINSVYQNNPYADIMFVLITDKSVIGTEFKSLKTIKSVAEYYGLPTVDVGQAMWKELNSSTHNWDEYYSDSVHPSDAGHKVYADTVFEKMEELMINGGKFKYKLPEETMCENGFTNVSLLTRDTFKPFQWGTLDDEVYGAAWWFDNDVYEKSGCPFRTSYARCFSKILPKYIYPKYDGATVEFTVNGNNIGILGTIKEGQSLTVTLDGKETITINGTSNVALTEYPLWNSIENTEHTVKIVANGDGPYIALAAVVVGN